jgi:hypothetical protein
VKLPLKVIGYQGFVQDISPERGAIVIPPEKVTDYEDAISEVKEFEEYAPYKDIMAELVELKKQTNGVALVKARIKKFAQDERRRSRQAVQAQFKLPAGKEKQTYAYDPITLAF